MRCAAACLLAVALVAGGSAPSPLAKGQLQPPGLGSVRTRAEALAAADGLPAHIVAGFREATSFVRTRRGSYLVFDARAQAVYSVDAARTSATRIVEIGGEPGRILRPSAFAIEPGGGFVVVDSPAGRDRVQRFSDRGQFLNAFLLPARSAPSMASARFAVGRVPSVQYTLDSIFFSDPSSQALLTEYTWNGQPKRSFGALRPTADQADDLRIALNAALPLVDPSGGFYVVFQTGVPTFRKYDAAGTLVFERHVEGRELDETLGTQPTTWPRRQGPRGQEWPAVPIVVRTAAVDPGGRLWVALAEPFVYVYSPDGEKLRTYQLRAGDPIAPTSLFFESASRLLVTPGCRIVQVPTI